MWPEGVLENPGSAARLAGVNPSAPVVSREQLAQLRIGMTPQEVVGLVGAPLAQGGNRRLEYLVRDEAGHFVGSIWFNKGRRLWMADAQIMAKDTGR